MKKTIGAKKRSLTTVQLRPRVAQMLQVYVRQGYSKSELINEALLRYLREQEFQEIRRQLVPLAQAKGIYTDEDVMRFLDK